MLDPMLEIYVLESHDFINNFEKLIFFIKKENKFEGFLDDIVRILHTLKGSSNMMLFSSLSKLLHNFEELFLIFKYNDFVKPNYEQIMHLSLEFVKRYKHFLELVLVDVNPNVDFDSLREDVESFINSIKFIYPDIVIKREESKSVQRYYIAPQNKIENKLNNIISVDIVKLERIIEIVDRILSYEDELNMEVSSENEFLISLLGEFKNLKMALDLIKKVSLKGVLNNINLVVDEIAYKLDKEVEFRILGEDLEVDRKIAIKLKNIILQIVRNSVVHGIETKEIRRKNNKKIKGNITIHLKYTFKGIEIIVEDDGVGIDIDRLKKKANQMGYDSNMDFKELLFLSGLSTTDEITEYSGRGYGLDIVIKNVKEINGTIDVETKFGKGTKFIIVFE